MNRDIKAYYYPRESFADLWRLYYRYGGARVGNFKKHRKLTAWRQMVPPLFFLVLLSLGLLSPIYNQFFELLILVVGVYCTANFFFSLKASIERKRIVVAPLLVSAFFCMHFGYAI